MQATSWQPAAAPETRTTPLSLHVELVSLGWQTALNRPPKVTLLDGWRPAAAPGIVSMPLAGPKIETVGFTFPTVAASDSTEPRPSFQPPAGPAAGRQPAERHATRFKPPADVIKLEDRLYYLLQPPLETLLADQSLEFPCEPFPYQLEGIAFLYPRCQAILADEMGLGKTMQAITAIRLLLHGGEVRRVLLVCPKPLVTNWQREFARWAPEVPLTTVEGSQARRRWQWGLREAVVTIANYELLVRDRETVGPGSPRYDLVVLDESQRIKNLAGATSQAVRSVRRRRSWALTGTPVENSPDDLVGIFEFLSPGYLRPGMKPRAMGKAVADYVLRRTKDRVLTDLPPKMFRDAQLELTPEQRAAYTLAEEQGVVQLNDLGDDLTIQHVFELVLRLKQICNFDPATGASAKLERLQADLEECAASGRKAIVFSQWVKTLTQLDAALRRFHPLQYHGQVPARRRDAVIEEFRRDPKRSVLLMSYGAGAVGLNLQFCGYVFLFDRWWNPAVEDQAINRAHRIGAAGPVTVTRFLSLDTIEQRIDQVLEEKRALFGAIFSDDHARSRTLGLSQQEIFGLFKLKGPRGPTGQAA